jgi:hypothetical protein
VFLFSYTGLRMLIASQETHEVVYKVTGTADLPDIHYVRDGHEDSVDLKHASLPWESEKLKTKGSSQVLSVTGDKQLDDLGTVRCEIWVDGKLVETADSLPNIGLSASCTHLP